MGNGKEGRMLLVGLCLVLGWTLQGYATTVTLQDGLNGYAGTADTWLWHDAYAPVVDNRNFGGSPTIEVKAYPWNSDCREVLIQFNNIFTNEGGSVPSGAAITSAKMRFNIFYTDHYWVVGGGTSDFIRMHPMKTNWVEGTANDVPEVGSSCENYRQYNTAAWSGSAYAGPQDTSDYYTDIMPRGYLTDTVRTTGVLEFDVTTIVQNWQSGTWANQGVLLYCPTGDVYVPMYSSDYATDPTKRPVLEIAYTPEPVTMVLFGLGGLGLFRRKSINV